MWIREGGVTGVTVVGVLTIQYNTGTIQYNTIQYNRDEWLMWWVVLSEWY